MNRYYYPRYSNSRRLPYHQMSSINSKEMYKSAVDKEQSSFIANQSVQKKEQPSFSSNQSAQKKEPTPRLKHNKSQVVCLNLDKPILEFHGIQIYQDDVLILMLLFFLYKENVNDGLLYIALLALLVL